MLSLELIKNNALLKIRFCPGGCGSVGWAPSQKLKVAIWIPGQGTCRGCRSGPYSGSVQGTIDQCFSLTLMFLSLSFSSLWNQFKNEKIHISMRMDSLGRALPLSRGCKSGKGSKIK